MYLRSPRMGRFKGRALLGENMNDIPIQNIPIVTPEGKSIRDAFLSQPGDIRVEIDFSQIELRLAAMWAKEIMRRN